MFISSELDELLNVCDRIYVFAGGDVIQYFDRGNFDKETYPEGCLEAMEANFKCYTLDAAKIAMDLGSAKCMNIVLFGAMTKALELDEIDWEEIIRETVPPKFLDLNLAAYRAGRAAAE